MQNIAEFRIIGRVGKITTMDKVTFVEVASNYSRKVNGEWKDDTHWNRVTLFGKLQERAEKLGTGDLVHITGRIRQSSFEKNGEKIYGVDLIADRMATLIKKDGQEANHDDVDDDIAY